MMKQRVQKLISQAGIASRRKAEDLIRQGRVKVDGEIIEIGASATKDQTITVDDKPIVAQEKVYLKLYKPRGILSTTHDDRDRKTVMDLIDIKEKIFLVGRLDRDAEGLIIMTNDGAFAQRVMHPSYEVQKTYEVRLQRPIEQDELEILAKGVKVENRKVKVSGLGVLSPKRIVLTIHEGRKHIVKKMIKKIDHTVLRLKRIAVGEITLGSMKPGESKKLNKKERESLTA